MSAPGRGEDVVEAGEAGDGAGGALLVAIDGPAGAGKSTVAAALARRLDLPHVDTGAFYRAVTLAALRAGADPGDPLACAAVARRVRIHRDAGRTFLDGEDVEEAVRGREVTAAVSRVSAHPEVRELMVRLQRAQVGRAGAVVEGRDAGTVVVPHADLKVWLTASVRERSLRRAAQAGSPDLGAASDYERELADRDAMDARQMAPAPDAVHVDTTGRSVPEILDELVARAGEVRARHGSTGQ